MVEEELKGDPSARRLPRQNIFFTNTVFYTLLRLIEMLYSRLHLFKDLAAEIIAQDPRTRRLNHVGPTDRLQNGETPRAEHYYEFMLESCERLFDNELKQHAFEDQMRGMFGTKNAYQLFTIDKLVGTIVKQVQAVFLDSKSQDLLEILKRERSLNSRTTQDQINSRRNAEKVLGPDENPFRIDWLSDSKTITIQLIGKDFFSFHSIPLGRSPMPEFTYKDCLRLLALVGRSETTPGISQTRIKRPFLRRNIPAAVRDTPPDVSTQDGLEIKVCVRTYRLFYVSKQKTSCGSIGAKRRWRRTPSA
ncbi:Sin3 protein [Laccaria bicolor S238N-H82]|uniref:Sin3 protein n=1 Tax=Laccaria bicolor (strain S238N-H82 / ATCC MYA-4686) TaxID=486041 RepID=B0D7Z4_LACBS|nr:Sin3 protein [Laccaria bicolor S238N-H82]EDR09492.1 Sin3 protein [Laccaria bicolor S238N-H82]|eukprot:XP_001879841.1 Sin3 protein [Laccaria bicolor S238N-H82]